MAPAANGRAIAPYYSEPTVYVCCGIVLAMIVVVVLVYVLPEDRIREIVVLSGDDVVADLPPVGAVAGAAGSVAGSAGAAAATSEAAGGEGAGASALGDANGAGAAPSDSADGAGVDEAATSKASYPPEYGPAADPRYGLSARELQIMALFAQGRSANWIAEHLVISKNTVRTHLRSVYTKLGVHSRQELLNFIDGNGADSQGQER